MFYEKEKICRLVEYKENIINEQTKNDIEWLIEEYNKYFISNREYEYQSKDYKKLLKKIYDLEDEKISIKENFKALQKKYKVLKDKFNDCCTNSKSMI